MRHLLNRVATVRTYDANGFDVYGNTTYDETDRGPYPCRIDVTRSVEQTLDRETVRTEFRAFFLPDADIKASDAVVVGDTVYRVDGDPIRRDGMRDTHHLEAILVEVRT